MPTSHFSLIFVVDQWKYTFESELAFEFQWGEGITGHTNFIPDMSQKQNNIDFRCSKPSEVAAIRLWSRWWCQFQSIRGYPHCLSWNLFRKKSLGFANANILGLTKFLGLNNKIVLGFTNNPVFGIEISLRSWFWGFLLSYHYKVSK